MSRVIVDTNVAVVANGQSNAVNPSCVTACIEFLVDCAQNIILLDSGDEIRAEYAKALKVSKPVGLGGLFLINILRHQFDSSRVQHIDLEKDAAGEFVDFPTVIELSGFDRDDRKFAALAKKSGVAVSNAVDGDWADYFDDLKANGIRVNFLCGANKDSWFCD